MKSVPSTETLQMFAVDGTNRLSQRISSPSRLLISSINFQACFLNVFSLTPPARAHKTGSVAYTFRSINAQRRYCGFSDSGGSIRSHSSKITSGLAPNMARQRTSSSANLLFELRPKIVWPAARNAFIIIMKLCGFSESGRGGAAALASALVSVALLLMRNNF